MALAFMIIGGVALVGAFYACCVVASRRVVNGDLIAEGYDIVTGERVCS